MNAQTSAPAAAASPRGGGLAGFRRRFFHVDPTDDGPVVLRHRRIYILPTRRGLAFIGTVLTMLVTSLNYALSLGFMVTFLLSGLIAAALLHAFRNLAGMEIRPLAAGEAFAGEAVPFTLALGGGGIARSTIVVAAQGSDPARVDVPAGGTATVTLGVPAPHRGRQALGRVTLYSEFPLGLWHAWAYVHFPLAGVVFPAPEPDAPPLPPGALGSDAAATARGEENELAGVRAYQAGDPMPRIAWKSVARGAGWYTKQFEGSGGGGALELAWHALPGALDTEARLARLTAWVLAAERTARPFALALPGAFIPEGQGRAHRRRVLTALALFPPTPR